jgi:hypothetical protein
MCSSTFADTRVENVGEIMCHEGDSTRGDGTRTAAAGSDTGLVLVSNIQSRFHE